MAKREDGWLDRVVGIEHLPYGLFSATIFPMIEEKKEDTIEMEGMEDSEKALYELGYLLVPTLPEEQAGKEAEEIASLIGELGAIRAKEAPKAIELAYGVGKRIKEKRVEFGSAFFGWMIFEIPREEIARVKDALEKNDSVLRFLIIKRTEKDIAAAGAQAVRAALPETRKTAQKKPAVAKKEEEKGKMDTEQVDSAIAELIEE